MSETRYKVPTKDYVDNNVQDLAGASRTTETVYQNQQDILDLDNLKANKVELAVVGNFATLNGFGDLVDSGRSEDDFEFVSNKTTSFQTTPDDTRYPTEKLVKDSLDNLQGQIDSNDNDISGLSSDKADKVGGATTGNFAGLDTNGNITDSGDNSGSFTPASHVGTRGTSHDVATTTINGFMSSADKVRLDDMEDSANNYSLPTASAGTLGGVKIGSGVTISAGVISVSTNYQAPLSNVASGYDYVIKNGNVIRGLKGGTNVSLSLSSDVITITSTDTNTTYSAGVGLTLAGTTFSVDYGTTADTACEGNDSRLVEVENATSANTSGRLVERDVNGSFQAQSIVLDGDIQVSGKIQGNLDLPIGTIWMYDGTGWVDNSTLPNWYACIPENSGVGAPDLVDRFIMGGASSGATGGANSITLAIANMPSHTHGASHSHTGSSGDTSVSHTHSFSATTASDTHAHRLRGEEGGSLGILGAESRLIAGLKDTVSDGSYTNTSVTGYPYVEDNTHSHSVSGTTGSNSITHNHSITINSVSMSTESAGSGTAFDNRPAYYSMIFIRKCV